MPAPLQIPADLYPMLEAARRVGRPHLVGGGVRDWLLGLKPKDFDVEVAGTDFDRLHRALEMFGATDVIGRSFGVIKVRSATSGDEYDFSLPRRESKTGSGHRGFAVAPNPTLTDAEAAARRDFTINAIALDPFTGEIIDPHGGQRDLQARLLRHTSAAFVEDPLRVLRAFQLAARFDLTLAPETAALCRSIAGTYAELPVERVWGEWDKWATKAAKPSRGLAVLEETGWLAHFPEVAALRETPQEPEWHPEGDVFTHTQCCVDALVALPEYQTGTPARRRLLMLAVLAHDFGKPATTARAEKRGAMRWVSPGHEAAGAAPTRAFLRRIGAPFELDDPVSALVVNHLAHQHGQAEFSDSAVRRLARKLAPATIDDLAVVMRSDANGRPPIQTPETHRRIDELVTRAHALQLADAAPKPILLGRHLLALGMKPGPEMKPILDAAFEAQLDGAFGDEAGATAWARPRLPSA
ncbi:polynucleotide adenylyltransferase [Opitutus sp. ER46]|uniref:CCA tRNA nucleotidyltransferase n=1 Tax=Opitutus sp. ER46 TaxID=2161864 RepID=UPI001E43E691|nr:polynucleotide adenylyltransferase [Opitutus sp. ER46]